MAYTPTQWVNGQPPALNAENLNKIEDGIVEAHGDLNDVKEDLSELMVVPLVLHDGYVNSGGTFDITTQNGVLYSDSIPVGVGDKFRITANFPSPVLFWNAYALYNDEQFIKRVVVYPESQSIKTYSTEIIIDEPTANKVVFSYRTFGYGNAVKVFDLNQKIHLKLDSSNYTGMPYCPLELGDIYMSGNSVTYRDRDTRVRTKEGYRVALRKNDVIKLKDYSDARYYVGWFDANGMLSYRGWLTSDFVCLADGEYIILLCHTTDVVTTLEELANLLVIEHKNYASDIATEVPKIVNYIGSKIANDIVDANYMYANYNVKGINHRGYNSIAPENTLSAYRLSKAKGFKYVETDVSFTSDGVAVLLHDDTIDRTSNGTGNIANMTYSEVRQYDFGSWKSAEYTGEKIPSFNDFINLCRNLGLHPYIELKTGNADRIGRLVTAVKRSGMQGKVTWISFNTTLLNYVKSVDDSARLGRVCSSVDTDIINACNTLKTDKNEVFVDCDHRITQDMIQMCIGANLPVEVWTLDDANKIKNLDTYITGVAGDYENASRVLIDSNI